MDYKKLYEEALKRAKAAHNSAKSDKENGNKDKITEYTIQLTETIFSELKESEDEQHRKWILEYLYDGLRKSDEQFKGQFKVAIAWLEKQGEQMSHDKVEPKFKIGDWVVNQHGYIRQIIDIKNDCYYCIRTESSDSIENPWHGTINYVDEQWHKWTIQDAKVGDVLYHKSQLTGIEYIVMNRGVNNYGTIDSYFRYNSGVGFDINVPSILSIKDDITPATKEQRDFLFQKMKEAGYEWDAEKKDLKKIEQNLAWSEEDEKFFKTALWHMSNSISNGKSTNIYCDITNWLKTLKGRIKGE